MRPKKKLAVAAAVVVPIVTGGVGFGLSAVSSAQTPPGSLLPVTVPAGTDVQDGPDAQQGPNVQAGAPDATEGQAPKGSEADAN